MSVTFEAIRLGAVSVLSEDRSSNAKLGIVFEALQEKLEMVLLERDVGVQISHDVVVDGLDLGIPGVEAMSFGGKAAVPMLGHVDHFYPDVERCVVAGDGTRAIS